MPLLLGNTASAGAGGVPAGVTTESLLFYVDAGVPQSYPGTGSTWFDLSGNNINLTLNNTSFVSTGSASYFNFDGVLGSSRATSDSSNPLLDFGNTFSTSITIFGDAGMANNSTNYHEMYAFGYDSGGSTFSANVWRSGLYPGRLYGTAGGQTSFGSGGYLVASPEVLLTSTFNHLTWTYSATEQKLYRNGVLLGTYANSGTYPSGGSRAIWIGGSNTGTRPWWGSIYTAAIWKNKALTQTEVTNSWNAIKARYGY